MALKPEQLEQLPINIVNIYQELEDYILTDFARRLAKAGTITDMAKWQAYRAKEIGISIESIKKEIERVSEASRKEIDILFKDAALDSLDNDNKIYKDAGINSLDLKNIPALKEYIEAAIKQTNDDLYNLTQSMGFAETIGGKVVYKPIAKYYHDALDFAQFQISSGVTDYRSAIKSAVKKLSESGLRYVDYESGWSNRLDVAVRRATLTGANQMSQQMTILGMEELGCEYVETSAHAGARPDHAKWQGKVFIWKGKSVKYENFEEATGYGTGDGICGWNCRHSFFPFFPGITKPAYTKKQLDNIDPKDIFHNGIEYTYYEATQRQRQIETMIRKTKRELILYKELCLDDDFSNSSTKLQRQKQAYKEFSKATGLRIKNDRHQVLGFDKSISQKSVWANKKNV
ncbi:MAG: phage minor capsid protein [Paraclostridium sp.]